MSGAPKVPGEIDPESDSEKVTGIAFKIMDDLIKEAGTSVEDPDYSDAKTQTGEFVQEL